MSDLEGIVCRIQTPTGWLDLQDPANGYELHSEAFATRSVQARTNDAENEWVRGSYRVRAVPGNKVEQLYVWVGGPTQYDFRTRLEAFTSALEQIQYELEVTFGNAKERMFCMYSDNYTVETAQPMRHARIGLVRAAVPRLPDSIVTLVE